MGRLMKPIVAEPAIIQEMPRTAPAPAAAPVVITFHMPAVLARPKIWAAALVVLTVIVVGLFALFGGDSGQAVIEAKNAHIQSLETLAHTALTQPQPNQTVVHGEWGYGVGLIGSIFFIFAMITLFLVAMDSRP